MRDEEINRAIAEACGWSWHHGGKYVCVGNILVSATRSLDAMHEAEKMLPVDKRDEYYNELFTLLPCDENAGPCDLGNGEEDIMIPSMFTQIHATARQRAEAFLRTLGKWPTNRPADDSEGERKD